MNFNFDSGEYQESYQLLKDLEFCVIDLETTGGNLANDQIIEIGIVKIKDFKITEIKDYLINPTIPIPDFIQKLTSITQDVVKNSPKIEAVIDEIIEVMGDSVLVAHNISFDIPFFNAILTRLKKEKLKNKVICTNLMTKHLIPELMNSNLNYMSSLFNIEHGKAHRAVEDARATGELFITFLKFFIKKHIPKINHLYYPKNKYELDRVHYEHRDQKEKILNDIDITNSPMLLTLKASEGVILCVLPIAHKNDDNEMIQYCLDTFNWTQATLKLIGSEIEGLLNLSLHYDKLDPLFKQKIIPYLNEKYPAKDFPLQDFDFFITRHLIPEQLTTYSLLNFQQKSHLIFRYPAQKKKLLQYFMSQLGRFDPNKQTKKINFHNAIAPIISNFLGSKLAEKNTGDYLFINKTLVTNSPKKLNRLLEDFIEKKPNPYNYPQLHL